MTRLARYTGPLFWTILFVAGMTTLLVLNDTAREVAHDALQWVFVFFATPFILETTCALIFLALLLFINQWRLRKEGDGWVYLLTHEPDDKNLPAKINQRLQSTVLTDKPEPLDEGQAESGVIEGYLELGMAAQALEELNRDTTQHSPMEAAILRIRVLAANLDTDAALRLSRETSVDPATHRLLATIALNNARWILQHNHREDLARIWIGEARRMDTAMVDAIGGTDSLRPLL